MCEGWLQLGKFAQGFAATDLSDAQQSQPPHILSARRRLRAANSVTAHCGPLHAGFWHLIHTSLWECMSLKAGETAFFAGDSLSSILELWCCFEAQ